MKKILVITLALATVFMYGCDVNIALNTSPDSSNATATPDLMAVSAVYSGIEKQPFTDSDGKEMMLDTIWIYYEDGSFEQYATLENEQVLFSTGTYELSEGADFVYDNKEKDYGQITINRTKKLQPDKSLSDYDSSHTYDLNFLGFTQIYPGSK